MNIAICDDEQICVDRLIALVEKYFSERQMETEICAFTDPTRFVNSSDLTKYDIVFLDANMGEMNGIDVAHALRAHNKTAVLVYVSAFVEYAPMGYQVNAFRYLLKDSLDKNFADNMDEILSKHNLQNAVMTFSMTRGNTSITISDILYIESFRHQLVFHLIGREQLESKQHTLSELEEKLKAHNFLRIHKSYLVNPIHILSMKGKIAELDNGKALTCGKQNYSEVSRAFVLWKGEC